MEDDYGYGSSDDEYCNRIYEDDNSIDDEGIEEQDEFSWRSREAACKVIRKESLLAAQKDDLKRVMDLLSLKEHHARTLLIHYCWDVDKVFAVFVEKGKERLYKDAGVWVVEDNNNLSSFHLSSEMLCEICYEDFSVDDMTIMDCGHRFCNECWTGHFIVKISEGQSRRITCMAHKCYSICDEEKVRYLVSARDPLLAEKFERFLLESYIEDNKRVKWCPSIPHCGNAIRIENDEYCEVECACGLQFCYNCCSEAHSPCSCLMWELWVRKCKDDSETINWITANTKFCPKCHKPVQKNGGCNLVRCVCGQPFCWLCGGATGMDHTWDSITNHSCGRYKEKDVQETEHARKAVECYTHYYNRYKAHTDSFKAEEKLKEKLQETVTDLESKVLACKDYSWVQKGFFRLTRSRRILLYTYSFAFFMFGDELFENEMSTEEKMIKQNLFEDQQQQLEANVEKLSKFLEELFEYDSEDKVLEIRMKVITLTAVIDNRCRKLYECIDNDLLGPLQHATHIIAPYRSTGVEKASVFS